MKSRINGPCKTASRLSASTLQHPNRFAIAKILAVGLLALAWPAAAQIVYTKVHVHLKPNSSYNLDLNNDGVTDFAISTDYQEKGCVYGMGVFETAASGNGAIDPPGYPTWPAQLNKGDQIGPGQTFDGDPGTLFYEYTQYYGIDKKCIGPWHLGLWSGYGYLGLMFQINGETYYGWAHLLAGGDTATVTGYAYEGTPGMPINAGQTK